MAAANLTPRQKMIGMMYLVLTALLALNVSKDILEAFVIVNNSLERSGKNLEERTKSQYSDFDLAKSVDPIRVTEAWEKAQKTQKLSNELLTYIEEVKRRLVSQVEGINKKTADTLKLASVEKKDDYDIPTNILIGELEDGSKGLAREIKNKLNYYKTQLTSFIVPGDRKKIDLGINTGDPPPNENNENWELYNFHNTPLAACITILSKIQNDTKNAETIILDYLLKLNDLDMLKFDTIAPKVIPQSNYVLLGEEYKADVFIAAFNKTQEPIVMAGDMDPSAKHFLGEKVKLTVEKGIGKYTNRVMREGLVQWGGTISMLTPKGKTITYPFTSEFIVAKPSLTVSADKMNVFYKRIPNPVSISVPGVPNERVKVTISNGSIIRTGNGKYMVTGVTGDKVQVRVSATMGNGETRDMGISEFRVKPLPKPYSICDNVIGSGKIKRGRLTIIPGIRTEYDKNFEFEIKCPVVSFTTEVSIRKVIQGPYYSNSNKFTPEMQSLFSQLRKGDKIYLSNIKGVDSSGDRVSLPEITIEVD